MSSENKKAAKGPTKVKCRVINEAMEVGDAIVAVGEPIFLTVNKAKALEKAEKLKIVGT